MLEENSQAIQECLKQSKFKHYTAKTTSTPFTMRFLNESIGRPFISFQISRLLEVNLS